MVIRRMPPPLWMMVLWMLVISTGQAFAQPRAVVEPADPQVYDTVTFTIRHNGALQVPQAHPSASGNLRAVNRVRQESSFSSVTGRTESVSWQFDAMEAGAFSIGPLDVMADGVRVTIPEVKGIVRSVEEQPTGLPADIDGSAGHPLPLASGDRALARMLRGKAFIVTEVPNDLLVGWPFRANTYFYLATSVTNAEPRSISPKPAGGQQFITIPELSTPHSGSAVQNVTINGQTFRRFHVHTTTVVPTRAGTAQFRGGEMGIDFLYVGRSSMRSILTTIAFESPLQEVEIRDLPPAPSEAHLQVIGNHTISTFVDRRELSQGDLVTLTIRLSGNGYLELASMDKMPEIEGLIFVREEVASQISLTPGNEYAATKMFRRVYQAEESGTLTIPPIVMANFNPRTNEQDLRRSDPITLTVASAPIGTQVLGSAASALPQQADAMEIGAGGILHIDKSPLRMGSGSLDLGASLFGSMWFWTVHAVLLLIVAVLAGVIALRRLSDNDSDSKRAASRRSQVAAALREAERLRGSSEAEPFYMALQKGMMVQLGRVLGREPGGLTLEEGLKGLRNLGAPESVAVELGQLLEHCQSIRYATGLTADSRDRDFEKARSLVRDLERLRR